MSALPATAFRARAQLLDMLLPADFPGAASCACKLRASAWGLLERIPTIVLLEVQDPDAPRAEVVDPVPVETSVVGTNDAQQLLLFVKAGLLASLELVVYDQNAPSDLPTVDTLAPPTVNTTHG